VISALIGGGVTGLAAWFTMGRAVSRIDTKVQALDDSFIECRSGRDECRTSIREHHEKQDLHVSKALMDMISDIQSRVKSVESHLMNGRVK